MSPFRNILKLSIGDFASKAAYFLAFVYMAQRLGVAHYGVLEFAIAVRTYLLLLADAGLEVWATCEAAKGVNVRNLAAQVIPARLFLAIIAIAATGILQLLPGDPHLRRVLPLLTLTVLAQVFNLKWALMGKEQMARVAVGLIASQLVFAGCVVLLVHSPADLFRVPIAFISSEAVLAAYFGWRFTRIYGWPHVIPDGKRIRSMIQPVLTLGASQCLGLMSYNVDLIIVGIFLGPGAAGWYAAAYKPVTAVLAFPITYYQGLFPALSRSYQEGADKFRTILLRSLSFTMVMAIPIGVGGTFLAAPLIDLLFGPTYARSVFPLQLLSWSAVLVTLRGNFRHTLNAVGKQRLDLKCAAAAAALNVAGNLVLIPLYNINGAAMATVISEAFWFVYARYLFGRYVMPLPLLRVAWRPALAGVAMAACLIFGGPIQWMVRAVLSLGCYAAVLIVLQEPELKLAYLRQRRPPQMALAAAQQKEST